MERRRIGAAATGSASTAKVSRAGTIACDEGLFAQLRALRKRLADERGVPPYVVFGDTSLRHMCRSYPQCDRAFLDIPGVGNQKLTDYGAVFMAEIGSWLASNPAQTFAHEAEPPPAPKMKSEGGINSSALETLRLHRLGKSMDDIAVGRAMSVGTIAQHLAQAVQTGDLKATPRDFYTEEEERMMADAAGQVGIDRLGPLHDALGGKVTYGKLWLFRAFASQAEK